MPRHLPVLAISLSVVCALATAPVLASDPILAPGDFIIAIDIDPPISLSSSPDAEQAPNVLDQDPFTKYLNFGQAGSGFIVTPDFAVGANPLLSFQLTTANDAEERDPASWILYGTDEPIMSTDHSDGLAENWTMIDSGDLFLPVDRNTLGDVVTVSNSVIYTSYKMIFPSVKDNATANSMQVADVQFYESTNAEFGTEMLFGTEFILAVDEPSPQSRYPAAESPPNAIDIDVNTKYLNFGEENSGFIVTPAIGSSVIDGFQITTANDFEVRDPASWQLYGTNEEIVSEDNSNGDAENWTLIDEGTVELPVERFTEGPIVTVNNPGSTAYTSYRLIFPTVKDPEGEGADSVQIAEIQFFGAFSTMDNADFDGDGDVDGADYVAWQAGFGITGTAVLADGDANGDGAVDADDLTIWQSQFGTFPGSAPASAAVPEPSACVAGLLGFLVVLFLRPGRG